MQKVIIGDATLYCGDSMEILPTLGECADLIVTDPPYKLTSGGNVKYADWHLAHDYDNSGSIVECNIDWSDFMPHLYNCLRGDSHAYIMANNRHVQAMLTEAEKAEFRFHNLLIWDKGTATPNRWYMKNLEFIGFFYKGKAKFINDCGSKQLIQVAQENYGNHPTTKPVALMEYYIRNSSQVGDTVIDPFMGVGSTAIAALKSGRKFIGIELEQKYFDLACKRITDYYEQPKQNNLI